MVFKNKIKSAFILASLLSLPSFSYSNQTQLVVGFPPGGGQYLIAQHLTASIPMQLSISQGAQGVIAMNSCLASQNSLCITTQAQLVYAPYDQEINKSVKYDLNSVKRSIAVGRSPTVLVALSSKDKNIKPDAIFGSGTAGLKHGIQQVINKIGLPNTVIVNYKGVGPAVNDVLGGHIDYVLAPWTTVSSFVKAGKLRVLYTTETIDPALQSVPTFSRALNATVGDTVFAILEPVGASQSTIESFDKLSQLVSSKEFKDSLEKIEVEPLPNGFNVIKHYSDLIKTLQ